jgi:hypothetical protein
MLCYLCTEWYGFCLTSFDHLVSTTLALHNGCGAAVTDELQATSHAYHGSSAQGDGHGTMASRTCISYITTRRSTVSSQRREGTTQLAMAFVQLRSVQF